jgi:hypothetical protein
MNRICGVMVSVLASNVVDLELEPDLVKPKTMNLVFVANAMAKTRKFSMK